MYAFVCVTFFMGSLLVCLEDISEGFVFLTEIIPFKTCLLNTYSGNEKK